MMMRALKSILPTHFSFRHPVIPALAALIGLGLIIGAPLLAQEHGDEHGTSQSQSERTGHDQEALEPGHAGETHSETGKAHGETEEDAGGGVKHFPTLVMVLANALETGGHELHPGQWQHAQNPVSRALVRYEAPIYSGLLLLILTVFFVRATRSMTLVPGKLQNFAELIVEGLENFVKGVLGPHGGRYVPFIGTLGLYIYCMNIFGLVPLMYSPTAVLSTTLGLALCVFLYVQYEAVRMNGVGGFLFHLAGEPRDVVGWCMVPLMFPLHVVGEIAKPISLSLRLFGNIMGEELLLAVFAGLGISIVAVAGLPVGIPLHVPFIFLALLTTLIQALVFTLLSTIYIALVMPHEEHH